MLVGSGSEEDSLPGLWRAIFLFNPHMAERASSGLSLSFCPIRAIMGFPGGSDSRVHLQCRRPGFDPGPGRSPGGGNGYCFQYSYQKNSMDRGAW